MTIKKTEVHIAALDTMKDFDALRLSTKGLLVVDFWAEWCQPCKAIAPQITKLAGKYAKVVFVKVDIEKVPTLADRYGIRAVPTFLFFRKGGVVETIAGADKNAVEKALKAHGA